MATAKRPAEKKVSSSRGLQTFQNRQRIIMCVGFVLLVGVIFGMHLLQSHSREHSGARVVAEKFMHAVRSCDVSTLEQIAPLVYTDTKKAAFVKTCKPGMVQTAFQEEKPVGDGELITYRITDTTNTKYPHSIIVLTMMDNSKDSGVKDDWLVAFVNGTVVP